ncbi:SIMPL domain-containing protein [Sphingomonas sp. ASV193]|uniref:SIMPL domain-containing protein n=1 Tax=Sphingomonas sp. ASV193 TaxID=3144405 RepID=UPI0032E8E0EC
MITRYAAALALAGAAVFVPVQAFGQDNVAAVRTINGTRLDVSASGSVTRVPDIATISAGVETRATGAAAALADNAARMQRVRAALKRAGVADQDVQTSAISLNPDYAYENNQPPRLTGYRASNTLSVKFRDLKRAGPILDALVAEGANQIGGPSLGIDHPEQALDEARVKALAAARARADLYARALGMRVVRIVSLSESGGYTPQPPMPMFARAEMAAAKTAVDPGTQNLEVGVNAVFELQ